MSQQRARFGALYEQTLPQVYGFLLLRSGGDGALAEDLTAETFVAAIKEFNAGRADVVDISWLKTVARRRLIDHWRRSSVARRHAQSHSTEETVADSEDLSDWDMVVETLGRLSPDERLALVLRHIDGHTVAEVAERLDRTPKATESLLGRARKAFRRNYVGSVENHG